MPDGYDFKGVFYVKSIPEIVFQDGMFHICHSVGSAEFEFVMQPNTFLKGLRRANEKAGEFHARDGAFNIRGDDEH